MASLLALPLKMLAHSSKPVRLDRIAFPREPSSRRSRLGKLVARLLVDDPLSDRCTFAKPEKILSVKRLLAPVDVPAYGASIRCLGTNYPIGGAKKPPFPILF